MRKRLHFIVTVSAFVLLSTAAYSQEQWEEGGEIESVEIEIVKEKQINLPRANRAFDKVPPRPAEPVRPEITYDFKALKFSSPDFNPVIRPLRLKQEELSKIYGSYLRFGYGNYLSPLIEGSINAKRNAEKSYGINIFHRSFLKGPVDDERSGSANTRLNLFAEGYGQKLSGNASLGYENIRTNFYGYRVEPPPQADIVQSYHTLGLAAGFKNTKASDFNFSTQGNFSYLTDHYAASESEVGVDFKSDYDLGDDKSLIFKLNYTLIARKDSLVEPKPRHLVKMAPAYQFVVLEKLRVTAGLNLVGETDRVGGRGFHAYPDVWARYALGKTVESYAGLTGDIDKVSLHTLSKENPWINSDISVLHTNRAAEFRAGIKGTAARKIMLHVGTSFVRFKHLYFYENATDDRAKFDIGYDNVLRLNFFGEVGVVHAEKVQVNLRGDYYSYATDTVDYAWHRPTYKLSMNSSFKVADKVLLTFNFIGQGGMKARDYELNKVVELKPALDLNAKVEYFLSKQLSFFVEGNNILNSSYPLYLHYPVRGVQVMAGLSWSF